MEGLPRAPHNGDRRVVSRAEATEQAYRPVAEPRQVDDAPRAPRRSADQRTPKGEKSSSKLWVILGSVLIVIILAIVGWLVWSKSQSSETGIDSSRYQSIHLMDGKIYFGKLSVQNDEAYKLTNVYYLDIPVVDTTTTTQTTESTNPSLVRLSKAIYGPEDEMIITKSQVLYFQNLTADGRGAQLIENDKQ